MKRLKYLLLVITLIVLSACSLDGISSLFGSDNNNDENVNDNITDNNTNDNESIDVKSLMEESFSAMQQVTSLHMSTELNILEENDGEELTGYRMFDVRMLLEDPYSQHYTIHIEDDIAEHYVSGEVYEIGEDNYFHSSLNDIEWEYFDDESTVQLLSETNQETEMEEYLSYSDQFEIVDESEDDYKLAFDGGMEDVIDVFYAGAVDMFEKVQMSMAPSNKNTEVAEFDFATIIDKDTFFVKGYEMYIKLQSTESDEDYTFETGYYIDLNEFNEHQEINVPQEIIDAAVDLTEEESDINPVRSELPTDLPKEFPLPEPIEIDYYEELTDDSEYYIIINFYFDEDDFGDEEYKTLLQSYSDYAEQVDYKMSKKDEIEHEKGDLLSLTALLPQTEVNERNHFSINMFSEGSVDKAEDTGFGKIHWRVDK